MKNLQIIDSIGEIKMINALAVNNNHQNNDYYNMFIQWFPGDKEWIDAIYQMAKNTPREAAIKLQDFLDEKIILYSKKSSQKKYAMAVATLKAIRERIIVPENPWKDCFNGLCKTVGNIIKFKAKKELIKGVLIVANKGLEIVTAGKVSIPPPIIDTIASGIAVAGKHLIKPLKIVAQKTIECTKRIVKKIEPVVKKVSSFVEKATQGIISGATTVWNLIKKPFRKNTEKSTNTNTY